MRRVPHLGAVAVALAAAVTAAYAPSLGGQLLWDDDAHVTQPLLRSLHGLWRIWFEPGATQQYYPVLHSAFWLEHRLWGDSVVGYHLANALLHAAGCLLLYQVLRRLAVPGALLGAFVFALHPVCVESVAWISEQKNTLSSVFYLGAALAYLRFGEGRRWRWYALGLLLFVLALLSKSVTASLPAALLVVLWWRRSLSWRTAAPLAPWFAFSAAAAVVTPWVERTFVGARGASFNLGGMERGLIAGRAVWFYLGKLLWPADLVFIYPRWRIDSSAAWQYLFPAAALGAFAALGWFCRRSRAPMAAALLFVGTLFPALGFINVYPFVFSYVADHFQYLAAAGMIPALCAAAVWFWTRLGLHARAGAAAGAVLVAVLATTTWMQCGRYRDQERFYRSILERNPDCWLAHDNLGIVLVHSGRRDEGIDHYRAAIRLNPDYPEAYNNLGNVLAEAGQWDGAAQQYALALKARPSFAAAEYNWGNAMNDAGRYVRAEEHLRNALKINPSYPQAHYALANSLANAGRLGEAVPEYEAALALQSDYPEAHANLGLALAELGRGAEGLVHIAEAVRQRPGYAEAHSYYGFALAGLGRYEEAVAEYEQALRVGPDNPDVHFHLAVALRKLGREEEARRHFELASRPPPAR